MKQKKAIPIAFNMSLGLIPLISCMILAEFIEAKYALLIGFIFAFIYSLISFYASKKRIFNFIVYLVTVELAIYTVLFFTFNDAISGNSLSFVLATTTLILTGAFFYGQGVYRRILNGVKDNTRRDFMTKSIDSSIVSARLVFVVGLFHFIVIGIAMLTSHPLSPKADYILFYLLPILLLSLAIGINQLAIHIASHVTKGEIEIPLISEEGDVIGKRYKMEIAAYKNNHINPVIRVAFIHDGMLFLCMRKPENIIDLNKTDLPLETYLHFGETLEEGLARIGGEAYPNRKFDQPRFCMKHHFKNEETNRLIYLYVAHIEDEDLLRNPYFVGGKLWTFQQIEANLNKNYFGVQFEEEYDFLKETARIWKEFR